MSSTTPVNTTENDPPPENQQQPSPPPDREPGKGKDHHANYDPPRRPPLPVQKPQK